MNFGICKTCSVEFALHLFVYVVFQTVRFCQMRGREGTIPFPPPNLEHRRLQLFHQRLPKVKHPLSGLKMHYSLYCTFTNKIYQRSVSMQIRILELRIAKTYTPGIIFVRTISVQKGKCSGVVQQGESITQNAVGDSHNNPV